MTTRNVIKFAAIFMLCMFGGLAVTLVRIAGPAGLGLASARSPLHGGRGTDFWHQQLMADAKTLVSAVRFWFEPERPLSPIRIPGLRSDIISPKSVASNGNWSAMGGILSTSTPSVLDSVINRTLGSAFDDAARGAKLNAVSGDTFEGTPNG